MTADSLLTIVQDIHADVRNADTIRPVFEPLWRYPLVADSVRRLLHDIVTNNDMHEVSFDEFRIVCDIFCPEFYAVIRDMLDMAEVG